MRPIEFDENTGLVRVCSFHPNASDLEVQASRDHPEALISHGICDECRSRVLFTLNEPRSGWLPEKPPEMTIAWIEDAREEIRACYSAIPA